MDKEFFFFLKCQVNAGLNSLLPQHSLVTYMKYEYVHDTNEFLEDCEP